ncbi:MAG: hypothetical protein J7619_17945 [Dyadobacter sp.]|uniref:hypothetical protein n=1 Tax=Dyadobacter sp. TaxID=1914288 RepID=UPI001B242C3D|nr:hypothetical protein [Dyadobacter sp.]MBO9614588.1 hypothetical protein [Dyadobacter sp.]
MQTSQLFYGSDAQLLAYGKEVSELLNSESPEDWAVELWSMFGGFMIAQKELGFSSEISNTFFSFRDLLFFFEKIEKIRHDRQ